MQLCFAAGVYAAVAVCVAVPTAVAVDVAAVGGWLFILLLRAQ